MKIGIVLEGGGLRGCYTTGVLDSFLKYNFMGDYVVGVSAGASHGVSYISRQYGRNMRINKNYIQDKRYLSFYNLITKGSLFGMEFLYETVPNELDKFDYDSFFENKCEFRAGVTNINTGKEEFFGKEALKDGAEVLKASSSIPLISHPVKYKGQLYLDGGLTTPIPIDKAFEDGCDKVIVVLTRDRKYNKPKLKCLPLIKLRLREFPKLASLMERHHVIYKENQQKIEKYEKEGKAIIIAPKMPLKIDRFEKNPDKLMEVYEEGFKDGEIFLKEKFEKFFKISIEDYKK